MLNHAALVCRRLRPYTCIARIPESLISAERRASIERLTDQSAHRNSRYDYHRSTAGYGLCPRDRVSPPPLRDSENAETGAPKSDSAIEQFDLPLSGLAKVFRSGFRLVICFSLARTVADRNLERIAIRSSAPKSSDCSKSGFLARYPSACERLASNIKTIANVFRTPRH